MAKIFNRGIVNRAKSSDTLGSSHFSALLQCLEHLLLGEEIVQSYFTSYQVVLPVTSLRLPWEQFKFPVLQIVDYYLILTFCSRVTVSELLNVGELRLWWYITVNYHLFFFKVWNPLLRLDIAELSHFSSDCQTVVSLGSKKHTTSRFLDLLLYSKLYSCKETTTNFAHQWKIVSTLLPVTSLENTEQGCGTCELRKICSSFKDQNFWVKINIVEVE